MNGVALGAFLVALAIVAGAFGSHALQHLPEREAKLWKIASEYHFIGAFGLVTLGLLRGTPSPRGAVALLLLGIAVFSGSLYAMALGAPRGLGRITPLGGLCLIAGWIWVGVAALRARSPGE